VKPKFVINNDIIKACKSLCQAVTMAANQAKYKHRN